MSYRKKGLIKPNLSNKRKKKVRRTAVLAKGIKPQPKENVVVSIEEQYKLFGKMMLESFKDKESISNSIAAQISKVEGYFKQYDSVQLLGGIGLYMIDNTITLEKSFMAQYEGREVRLDEDAEVLAEYALNFGLSMPNDGKDQPTDEVVEDLLKSLKTLYHLYGMIDMPIEDNAEKFIDWIIHSETIAVRGDGYQKHILEVFNEMFTPHTDFYEKKYGFSIEEMVQFFSELENRLVCKIGSQNMITGPYLMWERWKKWEERTFGSIDDINDLGKRDLKKGLFGDFFEANPDVPHTDDGMHFLLYQPDDYTGSDKIFWVWPQTVAERNIMKALSVELGDNASFIAEGEFKGNIMNGHSIYEKPFVKIDDRYYCFTPMIPHRNMFLIAEKLMMQDSKYYNKNFQQNNSSTSRDNYIESKVKSVLESFLPTVQFYPSVNYNVIEDGLDKDLELDILGVSDKAIYIIEVKAHELSHKDRVGLKGTKDKFKDSVGAACRQCNRAVKSIIDSGTPNFHKKGHAIVIDKSLPIYKIAVTFQHYSSLIGIMDKLIEAGLMEESYRDTWIVSLFDLMVCADYIKNEDEFIDYLELHKALYANHSSFTDELNVLNGFLNENLATKVKPNKPLILVNGSEVIDYDYSNGFVHPQQGGLP